MVFSRSRLFRDFLILNIAFFCFAGYYVINALAIELGYAHATRFFTVPLRLYVSLLCVVFIVLVGLRAKIRPDIFFCFIVFWILYLLRVIHSSRTEPELLSRSGSEFILFSISFGIIPFMFFYILHRGRDLILSKNAIILGSSVLSLFAMIFYRDLLGSDFGRAGGIRVNENQTIGALALSYSAILLMGISIYEIVVVRKNYILYALFFFMGCIPFVLGASRGSVVSFIAALLFIFLSKGKIGQIFKALALCVLLYPVTVFIIESSGSELMERMYTIIEQMDPKETRNSWNRIFIWRTSLQQFFESPWLGDFLENRSRGHHPHNIIIEALMTTGLAGGIPFVYIVVVAFRRSVHIIRKVPHNGWIVVVFMQVFIMNMFSGGIFGAVWFWSSIGLVLSISRNA